MAKSNSTLKTNVSAPAEFVCRRALALMWQSRDLLDGLLKSGQIREGSCPAETLNYLDDAIGMLTPIEGEFDLPRRRQEALPHG